MKSKEVTAFGAFRIYHAMKLHFTQEKYDYILYNHHTRMTDSHFEHRKDKSYYFVLAKQHKYQDDLENFLISNFINYSTWVGDFLTDDAKDVYKEWKKRHSSLSYTLENDLDNILLSGNNIKDMFRIGNNQSYPPLLQKHLNNNISPESFVILNDFVSFFDKFDRIIGIDDVLWSKTRLVMRKYKRFLHYDRKKIKNIFKNKINNA